jgi:hypothetical protein
MKIIFFIGLSVSFGSAGIAGEKNLAGTFRYLRRTGSATATTTECTFTMPSEKKGWSIKSVTERGKGRLLLNARFDSNDRLLAADVAWIMGDQEKTASVSVKNAKAHILRQGKEAQVFGVPPGVIVTSAPDWTDTFLLCRRYDRRKGGKQEFAGLWIHPEKAALRLTFTIERSGGDTIEHQGKKMKLDRFLIRLRNNSMYAAWADEKGRMIKLHPLPLRAEDHLVLEGYEKSAAKLRAR